MKALYITAAEPFSGKTSVALSILSILKEKGLKVGYFKPFGNLNSQDATYDLDVHLIKEQLKFEEDPEVLAPILLPKFWQRKLLNKGSEQIWKEIEAAYKKVSQDKDIMIIEGSKTPFSQSFLGLDAPTIAKRLNAEILFVAHGTDAEILDRILGMKDYFETKTNKDIVIDKVLFTAVKQEIYKQIEGFVQNQLEKFGIKTVGLIPESVHLKTPTVGELARILSAQILHGEENLDRPVQNLAIGLVGNDSALSFFRRSINKAVVLSGDRVDIALAALETSTSCLILTNNLYPDEKIIYEAKEANNTPLLLVPYGTRATVNIFESSVWRLRPQSGEKCEKLINYFKNYINLDWLVK